MVNNKAILTLDYTDLQNILHATALHWLRADQLIWLFYHAEEFQIINTQLIPVETEGIYRVDNEWNRDRNVWLLSSLQRQRSFAGVRFCIRLSVGYPFLVDGVLMAMFRRVIRLAPDPDAYDPIRTTFVHYMYRTG